MYRVHCWFQIDYEPRLEAFWKVGGFNPDEETYSKRKKDKKDTEKEAKKLAYKNEIANEKIVEPDEPVDHWIQYFGTPILQLRHNLPLLPLAQLPQLSSKGENEERKGESEEISGQAPVVYEVTSYKYDPTYFGYEFDLMHGTNIPGKNCVIFILIACTVFVYNTVLNLVCESFSFG